MIQDLIGGMEFVGGLVVLIGALWLVFYRLAVRPCRIAPPAQPTEEELPAEPVSPKLTAGGIQHDLSSTVRSVVASE